MKRRLALPVLGLFFCPSSLQAQGPLSCTAQSFNVTSARAEGHYEPLADIVIQCLNGSPAAGTRYASVEVSTPSQVLPFTSRVLDSANGITEALLMIGEPASGNQQICQTPQNPAACAAANVFPGIRVDSLKLRFTFPFTDPGSTGSRILRIVNLRLPLSQMFLSPGQPLAITVQVQGIADGAPEPRVVLPVSATVTTATARRSVAGSTVGGTLSYGCGDVNRELALSSTASTTSDGRNFVVRIRESEFVSAFRKRNRADPIFSDPGTPVNQNDPGTAFLTETGFYNSSFPGVFFNAGLPATAARVFLRIHGVPAGVKLFLPTFPILRTRVQPANTTTDTGWARRMITNADGAGFYVKASATTPIGGGLAPMDALGAYHQAVFEIVETDTAKMEEIDLPVYPAYIGDSTPGAPLTATVGFAPLSNDTTAQSAITPRFQVQAATPAFQAALIEGCAALSIDPQSLIVPAAGTTGTLTVTATSATSWTAISNASWITITSAAAGQGSGAISYTVAANLETSNRSGTITVGTATFGVTQESGSGGAIQLNPNQQIWTATGTTTGLFTVTASGAWTAVPNVDWVVVTSITGGEVRYSVAANPGTTTRTATITVNSAIFSIVQTGLNAPAGGSLLFIPMTPCRVVDTREDRGQFGRPALGPYGERSFAISSSPCGIPSAAKVYALNITVVPRGPLGYITVWPTGAAQPFVSTLNSLDGRIKANAALVPAGLNGAVSVLATDATELVVDVSGYFLDPTSAGNVGLAFYPLAPCRVLDTRNANGPLGGPILASGSSRTFTITGVCGVPQGAQAYSLNATVVPPAGLGYLTLWPNGQTQPFVSTLNSLNGAIVANAAIVPAGLGGAINAFVSGASHLVVDVNGYFAPPGAAGALRYYAITPCRLLDSRGADGSLGGPVLAAGQSRSWPIRQGFCGLPDSASAYSLNATVVPTAGLGFLTMWPAGQTQPLVSTLNAAEDPIAANALLLPAGTNGAVASFANAQTHLILDVNGYFAP